MLRRLVVLLSLLNANAAVMAHAADADIEAIKRAIVMDSAMTREDFLKMARSDVAPRQTDLEDQSLTFMLFVFVTSDKEKTQADFQLSEEGVKPSIIAAEVCRERRGDKRLIPYEPITCIHLDRITDCTFKTDGDTATGTVSFTVPGLYKGKAHFYAKRHDGEWFICEFSMPSLNIDIVREDRQLQYGDVEWEGSVWRQRPAKR